MDSPPHFGFDHLKFIMLKWPASQCVSFIPEFLFICGGGAVLAAAPY
jgi:hypothetical protein